MKEFAKIWAWAILPALTVWMSASAYFLVSDMFAPTDDGIIEIELNNPVNLADPSPARDLMDENGCCSRNEIAPKDVIPGHVVVGTKDGGARLAGVKTTTLAMDQALAGADHGLTIYGFCR